MNLWVNGFISQLGGVLCFALLSHNCWLSLRKTRDCRFRAKHMSAAKAMAADSAMITDVELAIAAALLCMHGQRLVAATDIWFDDRCWFLCGCTSCSCAAVNSMTLVFWFVNFISGLQIWWKACHILKFKILNYSNKLERRNDQNKSYRPRWVLKISSWSLFHLKSFIV